jgi:hypothetical protein
MVTNPLRVLASVSPGAGGNVSLRLTSETGRIVASRDWIFNTVGGKRITIDQNFPITVDGVAEAARMQIFTRDSEGRLIALSSEDLLLLSIGKTKLIEAGDLLEPFQLFHPIADETIRHGIVEVEMNVRVRQPSLLVIELVGPDRSVISGKQLPQVFQAAREFTPITATLQYQVNQKTRARLTLRLIDPQTKENLAVFSQVVNLYP